MNKIIAIDFDGTIVKHMYPGIGESNQNVLDAIFEEKSKGSKFILWTCRGGEKLEEAVEWCKSQGIEFDAINEDVQEVKESEFGATKSIKVYADEYWDDKNLELKSINKDRHDEARKIKEMLEILK